MPVAKVKGELSIYYEEDGEGPRALVFLGVEDALGVELSERLAAAGVRVVRYDPRGVGRTEARPPLTNAQHSADLAAVLRSLKILKPALLAVGKLAPIAVTYAARHLAEIRKLVLVSPELESADETKLGKVGEKALVLMEPDIERIAEAV